MNKNIFFKRKGPFLPSVLFPALNFKKKLKIFDINNLKNAKNSDLSFLDNINYINFAKLTKASYCITTEKFKDYLPKNCEPILVKNVLYELCKVTRSFYPGADLDIPDKSLKSPKKSSYPKVTFGKNTLVGKNSKIGKNSYIGSNTIIEQGVLVGENCIIGSHVLIRNSLIGNNVVVQDGCKIGLKGFGFIPLKEKNLRFPHIGKVIINHNAEIGANCTLDRGSINDTIIGKNTFLDNQVHVAHNVKIGDNCMIAGQVGFAGSSSVGDKVSIGGQAGVSGHLKIGNNVKIGGGSGVVKNIKDGTIVMGYPAVPLKNFIRNSKK
ncbi:UDP-3-O-(3-hydroxymyristoyl)glucosamine N-acyltransferase [Pelagibacteraceae bacterium]|nr:UDP-3-O-(3-hydroxymyristoyl)glucosamine N-acyltransferase [Pelagibacteraceae bacterium]|tara:strand:- start:452 stop:1420 length:969 start_codon:yes stop_codon:yes gene_type:complete